MASENINETISKEMLKQTENLGDTIKMISQVEQIVQYHEKKLIEEEKEGQKFDEKEIEELGIYTRNGMQYDKEGNLIGMTKKDL